MKSLERVKEKVGINLKGPDKFRDFTNYDFDRAKIRKLDLAS